MDNTGVASGLQHLRLAALPAKRRCINCNSQISQWDEHLCNACADRAEKAKRIIDRSRTFGNEMPELDALSLVELEHRADAIEAERGHCAECNVVVHAYMHWCAKCDKRADEAKHTMNVCQKWGVVRDDKQPPFIKMSLAELEQEAATMKGREQRLRKFVIDLQVAGGVHQ